MKKAGKLLDSVGVRFGIRDFRMDSTGFTLNGKPYGRKLIGVNRHQDYPFIGMALSNSLHWRDVKKFKDCGVSVFRTAHYPQDPAFMDACDELGVFVIVATPGWQFWNGKNPAFERRVYDDIEKMVRRDRSRPSLLMWEPILNETRFPGRFTTNAVAIVRRETLPPNDVCACDKQSDGSGTCAVNYSMLGLKMNDKPSFRREFGDCVLDWYAQNSASRVPIEAGEWPMLLQAKHYLSHIAEQKSAPPNHFGGCLWHGTDHARGYHPDNFFGGIMSYARRRKYSYYAFKAALTEEPFAYLAHELMPYSPVEMTVYSNCTYSASLFGRPFVPGETKYDYKEAHALAWRGAKWREANEKFELTLPDGNVVCKIPAGRFSKLAMELDTEGLAPVANGGDLVAVAAILSDEHGRPKRHLSEEVRFSVDGDAEIVGENPQRTRWGEAVVLIRPHAAETPGPIVVRSELARKGARVDVHGSIRFTPGSNEVASWSPQSVHDVRLRQVERDQAEFEAR